MRKLSLSQLVLLENKTCLFHLLAGTEEKIRLHDIAKIKWNRDSSGSGFISTMGPDTLWIRTWILIQYLQYCEKDNSKSESIRIPFQTLSMCMYIVYINSDLWTDPNELRLQTFFDHIVCYNANAMQSSNDTQTLRAYIHL